MDVLVCFQHNFVIPCGVMIKSLLDHHPNGISIHAVTDPDVTSHDKERICSVVNEYEKSSITFYDVDPFILLQLPRAKNKRFDRSVFYRLFLTSILPSTVTKVLYLDSDTLVVGDLSHLFNLGLGVGIAAVLNQSQNSEYFQRLNITKSQYYFNSGVLLINLEWWRTHEIEKKIIGYIKENAAILKNPDQDVLNYFFTQSRIILPLKYNVQSAFFYKEKYIELDEKMKDEVKKAIINPVIIHFTGWDKPWMRTCSHPYKDEFLRYKSQTIWALDALASFPLSYLVKTKIKVFLASMGICEYTAFSKLYK